MRRFICEANISTPANSSRAGFPRFSRVTTRRRSASGHLRAAASELAEWIASPDHPLTPRVMVNRIWQQLVGHGLVRTPDNFGKLGEPPTHPELLDHLASRFIESGWSVKQLVRAIVLSSTFRQSSLVAPEVAKTDPDNRLLNRMNRRRLRYEELRDAIHQISGQLAPGTMSRPGDDDDDLVLRTIYQPVNRKSANLTAAMFDFPDPKAIVADRAETTTAPQALFLMNNQARCGFSRADRSNGWQRESETRAAKTNACRGCG